MVRYKCVSAIGFARSGAGYAGRHGCYQGLHRTELGNNEIGSRPRSKDRRYVQADSGECSGETKVSWGSIGNARGLSVFRGGASILNSRIRPRLIATHSNNHYYVATKSLTHKPTAFVEANRDSHNRHCPYYLETHLLQSQIFHLKLLLHQLLFQQYWNRFIIQHNLSV